jgi:hypothetical protein
VTPLTPLAHAHLVLGNLDCVCRLETGSLDSAHVHLVLGSLDCVCRLKRLVRAAPVDASSRAVSMCCAACAAFIVVLCVCSSRTPAEHDVLLRVSSGSAQPRACGVFPAMSNT